MSRPSPSWVHDCDRCTFLGSLLDHDLYVCEQGGIGKTVVARFGDDGPEYLSGTDLRIGPIRVCLERFHFHLSPLDLVEMSPIREEKTP